jgi:hypothetical protein
MFYCRRPAAAARCPPNLIIAASSIRADCTLVNWCYLWLTNQPKLLNLSSRGLQLFRRPRRAAQAGSAESRPELTGASCIDTITATMA